MVVHPKYRTIGLGVKLVRETLPLAGTPYVEMTAVMAKYNPFAEKAGMWKIAEQKPPKQIMKIVETLSRNGFNPQLLSSEKYVLNRLQNLSPKGLEEVRRKLMENPHPRMIKCFDRRPFGDKNHYAEQIAGANAGKLAKILKVCGLLMQTKTYLFWQHPACTRKIFST